MVTQDLKEVIINQEKDLLNCNPDAVNLKIASSKVGKEKRFQNEFNEIKLLVNEKLKRSLDFATEKGSGAWLTALPIQSLGFVLNKSEFRDGIALRYGWKIPNTPFHCRCGEKNDVDHTLNCKLGGYVNMRHNAIRDLEANLLREVCKDVKTEPELLPVGNVKLHGTIDPKARTDVSAVGIWSQMERTFLDVCVIHPNSPSYLNKTPEQLYITNENRKKNKYNDHILQVQKGSFTPLIFSTYGGMGPECTRYHKKVAQLISKKRNENYADVMNVIRTKIRFSLMKTTLVAVRGERGRSSRENHTSDVSYNTIPNVAEYEV